VQDQTKIENEKSKEKKSGTKLYGTGEEKRLQTKKTWGT